MSPFPGCKVPAPPTSPDALSAPRSPPRGATLKKIREERHVYSHVAPNSKVRWNLSRCDKQRRVQRRNALMRQENHPGMREEQPNQAVSGKAATACPVSVP